MNMHWHIETDIFALLLTAIVFFAMRPNFERKKNRDLRFLVCVYTCVAISIIDIAASLVFEYPAGNTVFHTAQSLYHAANVLCIIAWYHYTVSVVFEDNARIIKRTDIISALVYTAYLVFVASNLHTGSIYTYDVASGYARGPLFFVPLGLFALYAVFVLCFAAIRGRRIADKRLRRVIIEVPLFMAIGIAVQLSVPGWLIITPSFAMGLLLAYLTIQQNRTSIAFKDLFDAASHDPLTGISNRDYAERQISDFLANKKSRNCALIIIDLDNFKNINDTFGHDAGDQALRLMGKHLSGFFRGGDIVARYGGDEFLVFLPDMDDVSIVRSRMSFLIMNVSHLKVAQYQDLTLSCSIGISFGKSGAEDFTKLLRQADAALYTVKRSGKNDFAVFENDMELTENHHTRVDEPTLKHIDWFDANELKRLLYALSEYLPYIASVNLAENTYYSMENAPQMSDKLPVYGEYDALVEAACGTFHSEDQRRIRSIFSRQSLIEAHKNGEVRVVCEARHKMHGNGYRWAQIACLFGDAGGENSSAFLIVRPHEDEHNAQLERMGLLKIFELAVQSTFEYICILDVKKGDYITYGNDGKNSHAIPDSGVYAEVVNSIAEELVPEDERDAFRVKACMTNIVANMQEKAGKYSYRYNVNDGGREAAFYYFESTRNVILMTVRKTKTMDAAK